VRAIGPPTRVGHVRWMGCGVPHRPPARVAACRRVRLRGAVRAGQQGGGDRRVQLVQRSLTAEMTHRHILCARRTMGG
jgi:hypothetical protein